MRKSCFPAESPRDFFLFCDETDMADIAREMPDRAVFSG